MRDVVTAAQVREAVKRLEKASDGVPLPSPIGYADAIAARKPAEPSSTTKAPGDANAAPPATATEAKAGAEGGR